MAPGNCVINNNYYQGYITDSMKDLQAWLLTINSALILYQESSDVRKQGSSIKCMKPISFDTFGSHHRAAGVL